MEIRINEWMKLVFEKQQWLLVEYGNGVGF